VHGLAPLSPPPGRARRWRGDERPPSNPRPTYGRSLEGRLETVEGPKDFTTYAWTDGVLSGEGVDGVTDILYTYDSDYPRLATKSVGTGRTMTRTWYRGMWVESDTYAESSGLESVNAFGDWDVYGQPGYAEATLDGVPQRRYDYATDPRGRLASVGVTTLGAALGTVSYGYYANGALEDVTTNWGAGGFHYARSGETLDAITQTGSGAVLAAFTDRAPLGRPEAIDLADGGEVALVWDQSGRIENLSVTTDDGTTPTTVTRAYTYDGRGRLAALEVSGDLGDRTDTFAYQEPEWLAAETRSQGTTDELVITYGYDEAGNRVSRDDGTGPGTTYTYAAGNVLTAVNGSPVDWDDYGGMVADHRGYGFVRGPDGGEIGLDYPVGTALYDFVRDAGGRQVAATDGVDLTQTVWGNPGADLPLASVDEDGVKVLNVAAEGLLLAQLRDNVASEAVTDLGGSLLLLDDTFLDLPGSFGDEAEGVTTSTERYVYAGLQSLPGTPFQMARQRLYDPELGRFTSMDPIGRAGGDHRFGYANGDPMGFTDPEGLTAQAMVGGAGGGGFYDPPVDADGSGVHLTSVWDQSSRFLGKFGIACTFAGCDRVVGRGDEETSELAQEEIDPEVEESLETTAGEDFAEAAGNDVDVEQLECDDWDPGEPEENGSAGWGGNGGGSGGEQEEVQTARSGGPSWGFMAGDLGQGADKLIKPVGPTFPRGPLGGPKLSILQRVVGAVELAAARWTVGAVARGGGRIGIIAALGATVLAASTPRRPTTIRRIARAFRPCPRRNLMRRATSGSEMSTGGGRSLRGTRGRRLQARREGVLPQGVGSDRCEWAKRVRLLFAAHSTSAKRYRSRWPGERGYPTASRKRR
jgi:RHS repeat-associated protein